MENIVVYAADIGSIKNKHFGWCRAEIFQDKRDWPCETDINKFVDNVIYDLKKEKKVAIGFECPLFIPIADKVNLVIKKFTKEDTKCKSSKASIL